jgi:hypothetical protein
VLGGTVSAVFVAASQTTRDETIDSIVESPDSADVAQDDLRAAKRSFDPVITRCYSTVNQPFSSEPMSSNQRPAPSRVPISEI